MPETYLSFGQNTLFCRHNTIDESQPSILLVHGLGDSGLSFGGIFKDKRQDKINIVVPDLLGYGRSSHSPARNYSFDVHLDSLWKVIDHFRLKDITFVGHSMGGDLGALLCQQEVDLEKLQPQEPSLARGRRIKSFLNVEGNLTEKDLFISGEAVQAYQEGRFEEWFAWDFVYRRVYGEWCPRWLFGRLYLASLQFCDPAAFLQNAIELYRRYGPEAIQRAGNVYRELSIRKLFLFGQKSLHGKSREFASREGLHVYEVVGSHHWPMIDCAEEFYDVVFRFCRDEKGGVKLATSTSCEDDATSRRVAAVKVGPTAEYDDPSVRATLEASNIPWLIRKAREAQDDLLWKLYGSRAVRIADIGCGNGYHAAMFAARCSLYHGYERSSKMVEAARVSCAGFDNVTIIKGDAHDVKLESERYDVIWSLYFTAGNLREIRETLSDYDDAYLKENTYFIEIIRRFFAVLEEGGSLFLTVYKDTPQAEEAQRSFYWRTDQIVLTDVGSRFVATDKGFWSMRWTREGILDHLEKANVPRANVTFIDLNEIAWLVEARR